MPLKGAVTPARCTLCTTGRSVLNATRPGARYGIHRKVTGTPGSLGFALEDEVNFASSETHTVNGSGSPAFAVRWTMSPRGPCTDGPCSSKLSTGGVFPTAASMNGEISHSGLRPAGMIGDFVFATIVRGIL